MQNRSPDDCPSLETLINLAGRGERSTGYKRHMVHIAGCPECFRLYRNLRKAETLHAQTQDAAPVPRRQTL